MKAESDSGYSCTEFKSVTLSGSSLRKDTREMIWIVNDHGDCIHASEFESSSYQRLRIQYDEFPPLAVKSLDDIEDEPQSE